MAATLPRASALTRNRRAVLASLLAAHSLIVSGLVAPSTARATTASEPHWAIGAWYRTLELGSGNDAAKVRQLATPLSVYLSPRENIDLVFATGANHSTVDPGPLAPPGDYSLSGLSDTKVKGIGRFLENRLLLSAGVGIPTGKKEYDQSEALVARALSQSLFGFRYRNLGQGLDVDLGAALATPLGEAGSAAFGLGYLRKGGFRLLANDTDDYEPGDEVTVTGGLDERRKRLFFRADATYHSYGTDRQGNADVFEEGNRFEVEELLSATWPRTVLSARARETFAAKSRIPVSGGSGALGTTAGPANHWGEIRLSRSLGGRLDADASASYARFGRSELELGDGYLAGVGAGFSIAASEPVTLRLGGQYLTGKGRVGGDGPKGDVSGFEAGLGLVYHPGGK